MRRKIEDILEQIVKILIVFVIILIIIGLIKVGKMFLRKLQSNTQTIPVYEEVLMQ